MVSRRTMDALLRAHERREQWLQRRIEDLTDRLMFLSGHTWVPAPADLEPDEPEPEPWRPDEDDDEFVTDGEQLIA